MLNSALSGLELVIGIGFGSLALIGDAIHNLGDVAGLLFGWGAERLSARPATAHFTYGFGRSTQLASLMNAALILMAAGVVIVEGVQRLINPVPVVSGPVAWAAAAGIVVNLLSARLFGTGHVHDLNRRAAVVHLLTDAAVSAAVLVSAVLVGLVGWMPPPPSAWGWRWPGAAGSCWAKPSVPPWTPCCRTSTSPPPTRCGKRAPSAHLGHEHLPNRPDGPPVPPHR